MSPELPGMHREVAGEIGFLDLQDVYKRQAEKVGAKLLSCSSDQVYAGVTQRGALAETLPLSPSNVYGQHKLEAEARVLARCPDAVVLRLPWMYDLPGYHLPIRGNLPLNIRCV